MVGEKVYREQGALPGAIITRVASSHIRIGTFEYFFARKDFEALETLLNYVIARHYPELENSENKALDFLQALAKRQADLIIKWLSLGFVHGVMNTDNCSISGETIDYGPCAFMDSYDPIKTKNLQLKNAMEFLLFIKNILMIITQKFF